MDDKTQLRNNDSTALYRCTCGADFSVNLTSGGECPECQRRVAAAGLQRHLSLTVSLSSETPHDQEFESKFLEVGQRPSLVGQRLGHFEVVGLLGAGGMGYVYRAIDTSLQRYVAVKVVSQNTGEGPADLEVQRLMREAISQARVNHPNVVSIYYVGKHEQEPFLAMELVAGVPASQLQTAGQLSFAQIASIGLQMTEALSASLEFDVLHGDIKPANILVQPNGVAKLSDFGMARLSSASTIEQIGGTPNYMAPELLQGQRMSIHSDMYSLGVTLYEMSFGKLPVRLTGHTFSEWSDSHQRHKLEFPHPWPEHLPEKWRTILKRLLHRDPAKRYTSYDELRTELLEIQPRSATPARLVPRLFAAIIDGVVLQTALVIVGVVSFLLTQLLTTTINMPELRILRRIHDNIPWYQEIGSLLVTLIFALSVLIPLVAYLMMVGYFRQSLGRGLMHVQATNEYGLPPNRQSLMLREILRLMPLFIQPVLLTLFVFGVPPTVLAPLVLLPVGGFTLVNLLALVWSRRRQALHDRLFKTHVVLDIN